MNAPDPSVKTLEPQAEDSRACVIFARTAGVPSQFGWGWKCGLKQSKGFFRYFYECVQDARKHGCTVDFAVVAESLKSHDAASS